jgi:hypothetical protein
VNELDEDGSFRPENGHMHAALLRHVWQAGTTTRKRRMVMARYVLIGLCEPTSTEDQAIFDEWFIDQHIEDTARCPNFIKGSVYKLSGPHLDGETVSNYLSLYEVEAESYEEAERALNEWQSDPDAWEGRGHHMETMKRAGQLPIKINGSGWYELLKSYDGPKSGSG